MRTIAENYRLPYYTLSPTYSVCQNHGYISGEAFTCPKCGGKAEVYSRITGYYRPVQNWNEGKAQEYKNRVEYDLGSSRHMPVSTGTRIGDVPAAGNGGRTAERPDRTLLFVTETCPNCRIAKAYLDGIS